MVKVLGYTLAVLLIVVGGTAYAIWLSGGVVKP